MPETEGWLLARGLFVRRCARGHGEEMEHYLRQETKGERVYVSYVGAMLDCLLKSQTSHTHTRDARRLLDGGARS